MSGARNRNILVISYYFPPLGMGGVQRVVSLTSHLTRLGWNVSVLTVRPFAYPAFDESLLDRVPKSVKIYRASVPSAEKFKTMFYRNDSVSGAELSSAGSEVARWAMLPDSKIISLPNLLMLLPDVIRESRPAAVVTSSPPPSIHLAGAYAKKRFGLRWIADFRDVWFPQSQIDFRTPLHRKLQSHLESSFVNNADAVVVVSDMHAEMLRARYEGCDAKVYHIPNGFEEADFGAVSSERETGPIRIGYCGTLNHLTYINSLFGMFALMAQRIPLAVDVLGVVTGSSRENIRGIDPKGTIIKLHGPQEHSEVVKFSRSRDINLITLAANSHLEATIPGKVYEALRAEKPVIAVVPKDGAVWRLTKGFEDVLLADASDVTASRHQIEEFVQNSRRPISRREGVEQFDWNNLAEKYVRVLRRVIG